MNVIFANSVIPSAGFLRVLQFSLLHLKLNFLNKSVSKHFIEVSLKFIAFALGHYWDLSGFPPDVIDENKSIPFQVIQIPVLKKKKKKKSFIRVSNRAHGKEKHVSSY